MADSATDISAADISATNVEAKRNVWRDDWVTERLVNAAVVAAALFGAILLWWFEPSDQSFFPRCTTYRLTGLHCPGCGAQRAIHHFLNGRFLLALQYNPLVVLTSPWILFTGILWTFNLWELPGRHALNRLRFRVPGRIWVAFAIALILFAILRNVPGKPFEWLAPPAPGSVLTEFWGG